MTFPRKIVVIIKLFVHIYYVKVYATVVAFYLPLIVIIILNTQIYIIARGIINREKKSPNVSRHFLVVNPSQIGAKTINTCTVKLVKSQEDSLAAPATEMLVPWTWLVQPNYGHALVS